MTADRSYNNLLDIIIEKEKQAPYEGNPREMFRYLVINCFYKDQALENRTFQSFLEKFDIPIGFSTAESLVNLDINVIRTILMGDSIDKSFAAQVMFSKTYLKYFQPHHPSDFSKIPNNIKVELRQAVMKKNEAMINGFNKIHTDMRADKKRTMLTLVALCLKNINRRTGRPLKITEQPVEELIRDHIKGCDKVFTGDSKQLVLLNDMALIRDILKQIFNVKSYTELKKVSDLFVEEVERFRKRAVFASQNEE